MKANKQRGYIGMDLGGMIVAFTLVGVVIGIVVSAIMYYVLPWAWSFIKPMIHAWTS